MSDLDWSQLRGKISAYLKARSFKRRQNWFRHLNGVWQVIDLQKSQAKPVFTLNLGITADIVLSREGEPNLSKKNWAPDTSSCILQSRLGQLLGLGDHWWPANSRGCADVIAALEQYALSWFGQFSTPESLRDHFLLNAGADSGRMTLQWAAMLCADLGPSEELERILGFLKRTRYFDIDDFCATQGLKSPTEENG